MELNNIYNIDCLEGLKLLEDNYINCCITSPPYWNMKDYGVEGQIGQEKTPDEYVDKLIIIFRELKRVLKKDGTLWLNLGDKYMANKYKNIKAKDLIGLPWMVAFALRNDGWYLRQDIIWEKRNSMPESVKDRCSKGHEYLFLLSKSPKYYFNNIAMLELATGYDGRKDTFLKGSPKYEKTSNLFAANKHERWKFVSKKILTGLDCDKDELIPVRNKKSVWNIPVKPFKDVHFACVDKDTECLTISGWKKYNEIKIGEIAAEYDFKKQEINWGKINDLAIYEVVSETLIKINNDEIDAVLTPNHRTVIKNKENQLKIIRADEITDSDCMLIADKWNLYDNTDCLLTTEKEMSLLFSYLKYIFDKLQKNKKHFYFTSNNKKIIDLIQIIGFKLGYASNISFNCDKKNYIINFSKKNFIFINKKDIKEITYTGIVWCPSLPKGTWIARRNDKIFITGNTFPPDLVKPCILAGSKEGDIILDIFMGSGTTAEVALKNNRNFIGFELNSDNVKLAEKRLGKEKI